LLFRKKFGKKNSLLPDREMFLLREVQINVPNRAIEGHSPAVEEKERGTLRLVSVRHRMVFRQVSLRGTSSDRRKENRRKCCGTKNEESSPVE